MSKGLKAEKGTGILALTRYVATQEEAFTRAKEFVPQR